MDTKKILGVIGGVGPQATADFADMLVRMTDAQRDQDHIRALIFNDSAVPDRTDFILGRSGEDPLPVMTADARLLEKAGASLIAVPCNTAHYFYDEISAAVGVPVVNIIEETLRYTARTLPGAVKVGLMATKGTVAAGSYKKYAAGTGIEIIDPDEETADRLMDLIYGRIKAGLPADRDGFESIVSTFFDRGCGAVILGCTELSVAARELGIDDPRIIDSLGVLARVCIEKCGGKVRNPKE